MNRGARSSASEVRSCTHVGSQFLSGYRRTCVRDRRESALGMGGNLRAVGRPPERPTHCPLAPSRRGGTYLSDSTSDQAPRPQWVEAGAVRNQACGVALA